MTHRDSNALRAGWVPHIVIIQFYRPKLECDGIRIIVQTKISLCFFSTFPNFYHQGFILDARAGKIWP